MITRTSDNHPSDNVDSTASQCAPVSPSSGGARSTAVCVLLGATIFVLAAFPRVNQLDYFLMVDENLWYQRSAAFLEALLSGDLSHTAQTGHPGVTTMWAGALGLTLHYLQAGQTGESLLGFAGRMGATTASLPTLQWLRLPIALLCALMVATAFGMAQRLVGTWPALIGAALMAAEPLFVAHSRVLHQDSPAAVFSFLAILGWLLYMKEGRRWAIVVAAIGSALAVLSKVSSVFLLLFAGLTLVPLIWQWRKDYAQVARKAAAPWLQLVLMTALVMLLVWPALWAAPAAALATIAEFIQSESGAHAAGTFFMGQPVSDAGPLYYPLSLAFTLTPLAWMGLMLTIVWQIVDRRRAPIHTDTSAANSVQEIARLLAYAILFIAFMTLIGKKQERYVLPAVLAIDLLAGWGWWQLIRGGWRHRWRIPGVKWAVSGVMLAVVLGGQIVCAWSVAPYYSTFYNPLVGGAEQAERMILIGRGEGLEQAARFIREHSAERAPRVASWYGTSVSVLFADRTWPDGRSASVVDIAHPQTIVSSDYVIFYINQLQRQLPKEPIIRYAMRKPLLHTVRLGSIDYAYVYKGDSIDHPVDPFHDANRLVGKANLAGFEISGALAAGRLASARLYWVNDGLQPSERFYVRLVDDHSQEWARGDCALDPAFGDVTDWVDDEMFEVECPVAILPGTPPGSYLLRAGITDERGARIGEVHPTPDEASLELERPDGYPPDEDVVVTHRVGHVFNEQIALIGYDYVPAVHKPSETIPLTFYWRALRDIRDDYGIRVTLRGPGPGQQVEWASRPVNGRYATSLWQRHELVRDPWMLTLPPSLPSGDYELAVELVEREGAVGRLGLRALTVQGREHAFTLAQPPATRQEARLGDNIWLLGYDLTGVVGDNRIIPGRSLDVALTWRADGAIKQNYVVFVQLLDGDNLVRAQHDGQPGDNALITTTWADGEYVRDSHRLTLPVNLSPGPYRLIVGMYLPDSGERLPAVDSANQPLGDHVALGAPLYVSR